MALKLRRKLPIKKPSLVVRNERRQRLRRTITALLLLVVIAGSAGAAYTWYSGQQDNSTAIAEPLAVSKKITVKAPVISKSATIGASIQSITSPVAPGNNASITIRSNPDANCKIVVEYNKIPAVDSGLKAAKTDDFGMLTWSWTVPASAPIGTWPIVVTCANDKKSAVVNANLEVALKKES